MLGNTEHSTKTFTKKQEIIFDRFIKISLLYTSNYHELIYVYDKFLDRSVVLKFIKKEFLSDENKKLLKNEFKIISSLRSQNIVRSYEFYKTNEYCFYSMEYIKNNFIEANIGTYCEQILDAFKYIHQKGILHNDIKNNNFLFTENEFILIDFSFCKNIEDINEIRLENQKLARYMIYLINLNLNIDFLDRPKIIRKYLSKRVIDNLFDIYSNKRIEII